MHIRVLPGTLVVLRLCKRGESRHRYSCCASRKTAASALRHPASPAPRTNPLVLLGPARSSAARILHVAPNPWHAFVRAHICAPSIPLSRVAHVRPATVAKCVARCAAVCAALSDRHSISRRSLLLTAPASAHSALASSAPAAPHSPALAEPCADALHASSLVP